MATSHHSSHFEGQKCQVCHQSSNTVSQPFGPLWSNFNTPLNRFLLSRSEFNQLACSTWQTSLYKMASLFRGPLWTLIQDKNIEIVWLTHGMINVSNIQSSWEKENLLVKMNFDATKVRQVWRLSNYIVIRETGLLSISCHVTRGMSSQANLSQILGYLCISRSELTNVRCWLVRVK